MDNTKLPYYVVISILRDLEKQGFSKEEIWKRIGRENDYEDQKNKFLKAKKESNNKERELKIRINEILKNPTKLY